MTQTNIIEAEHTYVAGYSHFNESQPCRTTSLAGSQIPTRSKKPVFLPTLSTTTMTCDGRTAPSWFAPVKTRENENSVDDPKNGSR